MVETRAIRSRQREELINIDGQIADFLKKTGAAEGTLTVFVPHTTAAVTINENADPTVAEDIVRGLGRIAPLRDGYRHREGNSDAHIKSSLVGHSATLIVSEGKPLLGTWQSVYFCEFDGPRNRSVILRI
jgi:secondary thiamine-phosphate synthase enzyme